jgi:hypothetical protein
LGYTLVAANVATESGKPFEDWWVSKPVAGLTRPMGKSALTIPDDFMRANGLYEAYERLVNN